MIKYCGKKLSKEEIIHRRKKARQYFEALGINPDIKGGMYQERRLDMRPKIHHYNPTGKLLNAAAEVQLDCFLFYTHIVVTVINGATGDHWTYYGNAGGVGAPGGLTVAGADFLGSTALASGIGLLGKKKILDNACITISGNLVNKNKSFYWEIKKKI